MATAGGIAAVLAATQPWVRLVSILGFLSAALMIVSGVVAGIAGVALTGDSGMAALGLIYPLMGILYIIPSVYLFKYASRIADYVRGGQEIQLEMALDSQRSFWKFVGVLAVVSIVLMILGIAAAILIPAFLRASQAAGG